MTAGNPAEVPLSRLAAECAAVVPCLNEAAAIEQVVRDIRVHLPAVIVVDDGSSDATAELAGAAGAEVIRHGSPQGKGRALTAGWRRAHERGFRWALSMDGDGQHAAADIPRLLSRAAETGACMVVGNRMGNPVGMPWVRRMTNRWMSRRISKLIGQPLPDTQNGFRLMDLEVWAGIPLETGHFEIESELLCRFVAAGHPVSFVPCAVIYRDERSKIHPLRDTLRWFRWWLRAREWCRTPQPRP